jgi:hypothetical protein
MAFHTAVGTVVIMPADRTPGSAARRPDTSRTNLALRGLPPYLDLGSDRVAVSTGRN